MHNFAFYGGRKQLTTKFYFSYCTWIRCLGIQLQEGSPTFDKVRVQGLQILLTSGVTVTSASQILESFWNIWSQVSQRKKPFSDFPARGPGMYTLS